MRWFGATWTFWSHYFNLEAHSSEDCLEVKAWYQCRSCRVDNSEVACPYCYERFDVSGEGLGRLHERECPHTYEWRLRYQGCFSVRMRWESRYEIQLMTATTCELREKDLIRL